MTPYEWTERQALDAWWVGRDAPDTETIRGIVHLVWEAAQKAFQRCECGEYRGRGMCSYCDNDE